MKAAAILVAAALVLQAPVSTEGRAFKMRLNSEPSERIVGESRGFTVPVLLVFFLLVFVLAPFVVVISLFPFDDHVD